MSKLQNDLNTLQNTVKDLASAINEVSISNGTGEVISECTSFTEYPDIIRSISGLNSGGIVSVFAYRISDVDPGIPEDDGDFNFENNEYTAPSNWKKANDLNATEKDTVWMSQAMFVRGSKARGINSTIVDSWSKPIRIANFSTSSNIEQTKNTVYFATKEEIVPNKPVGTEVSALNAESLSLGWSENYIGVSEDKPFIWISTRDKSNGIWSQYTTPVLYAKYGRDGENGGNGLVSRTAFAFKATKSRDEKPNKPIGGKWDINSNDIILPEGWYESPNADDVNRYSWVSNAVFTTDNIENPEWTNPICITGEDGVDGTDGVSSEFIYATLSNQDDFSLFKSHLLDNGISLEISQTDTVPNFISNGQFIGTAITTPRSDGSSFKVQLTDSPIGIDDVTKVEIYWTRTKSKTGWSSWIGPMYWSVWGENGMDGDGVEYIFTVSNDSTCDIPLPIYEDLLKNDPEEAKRFQEREYLPTGWHDDDNDWDGVTAGSRYLFCSFRKQYTNEKGIQMWGDFSTPKVWGHWGMDGAGSYTSFAFCVSKNDLSNYTVTGGHYTNSLAGLVTKDDKGQVIDFAWHDSVPKAPAYDEYIWMINKFFNGTKGEEDNVWYGPAKMADSEHFQVEFNCPIDGDSKSIYDGRTLLSLESFKQLKLSENPPVIYNSNDDLEAAWRKYVYANGYGTWNDGQSGAIYMATARCVNNVWEEWSVNKIKGESGDTSQFIFRVTNGETPKNPTPVDTNGIYQGDNYKPDGWYLEPQSMSEDMPVCWVSQRNRISGVWKKYSDPVKWSIYAKGNVHLEFTEDQINVPCEENGQIDPDYHDFVTNTLTLYDNGEDVSKEATYTALINDDNDDFTIDDVLKEVPANSSTTGFLNNKLYIGRDFLDRYRDELELKVECRAIYKGVPYAKSFVINKSTNTYELELSHRILHADTDYLFKDNVLQVKALKWVEDKFVKIATGYIDWIFTYEDGSTSGGGSELDPDGIEYIYLTNQQKVKSIRVNYRLEKNSDILAYEIVGVVIDGKDGKDAVSKFKSQVFCRTNADISDGKYAPRGGSFLNPNPSNEYTVPDKYDRLQNIASDGTTTWTDGIPPYDKNYPKQIWMSSRWFYSDDSQNKNDDGSEKSIEYQVWTAPIMLQDTNDVDIWWCDIENKQYENPGNPPIQTNYGWYDGDDTNGNNITTDPYWMAVRRKTNGAWSDWTVSRVKGEKGDPGPEGPQGPQGPQGPAGDGAVASFGPMVRYGEWKAGNYYCSREVAAANDYKWYDIVYYDGNYYLCISSDNQHLATSSNKPGTSGGSTHWEKAEKFNFIVADLIAANDILAQRVEASKLITTGNESQIVIDGGMLHVYKIGNKFQTISLGYDETANEAVLAVYDDSGKLVWKFGQNGAQQVTSTTTIEKCESADFYTMKTDYTSDIYTSSFMNLITEHFSQSGSNTNNITIYICRHIINNVSQSNNGKYLTSNSVYGPRVNGTYVTMYRTIEAAGEDFSAEVEEFNSKLAGTRFVVDETANYKFAYVQSYIDGDKYGNRQMIFFN